MIALAMIVSGSEKPEDLERCLESAHKYVDGIYIVITTPLESKGLTGVAKKYGAVTDYQPMKFHHEVTKKEVKWLTKFLGYKPRLVAGQKIFHFGDARNYNMEMIPKEYGWMIWMDVDDILRGGKNLKDIIRRATKHNLDSVFLNYLYQVRVEGDKITQVMIEHLRERIIRLNGAYKWIAPIHETLIEQKPTRKVDLDGCDVVHLSNFKRREQALERNLSTLEYSIYDTGGKDPRPLYYLGKGYYDVWLSDNKKVKSLDKAKTLFEMYLNGDNPSGWAAERAQCWEYLVDVYRARGEVNNAIKCAHNALIEDETFPSIYINLATCYLLKKEYERAMFWIKMSTRISSQKNTLVTNPRDLAVKALEVTYHCSINTNKLDEAWAAATKLLEIFPENEAVKNRVKFTTDMRKQRDLTQNVVGLAKHLTDTGQKEKVRPLLMSTPTEIDDNPFISDLKNKFMAAKVWGSKEVAIFCGPGATAWGPSNLDNPGEAFIGGSEEAVIYLSKELVKLGWKVTVYADPGNDEGVHDGVLYRPYFKFNHKDDFNILVIWRRPGYVDHKLKAKKTYIWCHDIINALDYTPERLEKIHKVMVLSPWHRSNIPEVPDSKILVTGNGVDI